MTRHRRWLVVLTLLILAHPAALLGLVRLAGGPPSGDPSSWPLVTLGAAFLRDAARPASV